jgi:hypothetical protein
MNLLRYSHFSSIEPLPLSVSFGSKTDGFQQASDQHHWIGGADPSSLANGLRQVYWLL